MLSGGFKLDLSGAKTISSKTRAVNRRGSSGDTLWVAVLEEKHPPFPRSCVLLPAHRETGPGEPHAKGTETRRGLHPQWLGQMVAPDLLSHPDTLGSPSGKPPHDGTKANGDSRTRGQAVALLRCCSCLLLQSP